MFSLGPLSLLKLGHPFLQKIAIHVMETIEPGMPFPSCLALAARGKKNAKKRAVVAVARKLAVLLHRLWVTAEVYEPLRNQRRRPTARAEAMSA